jgi:carotenoid cleavage dioxygenase
MAQAFPDHPYLTGHHAPNRFEADAPDLVVEGEIPRDLAGVFYRNGPEPLHPTRGDDYHWFDGDGMIYAFFIEDGRVSMSNRWVRTEKFELERAAGKRLFGVFGNPMTSDPSVAGKRYNTANTNIILHGGKLLALMEGAPAVELDPRDLSTIGEETYGGKIASTFSAHPTLDQATGELLNIGNMIHGPSGAKEIRFDVIDAEGNLTKSEIIPVPHMTLMHTFLATENWVIFPVLPLDLDMERAKRGGPPNAWVRGRPSKLAVMPRTGTAADVRWFEHDPRHMFHELNVWEEDGKIIADVATASGTGLFPDEDGNRLSHAESKLSLRRWTFDLAANTNTIREDLLNDRDIQFPRPDDRMMTRRTRHGFSNFNIQSIDGRVDGMDGVIRFDTQAGTEDIYHFGAGAAAGEFVFAPRIGAKDEADGYAITIVHAPNSTTSQLAIFDAMNVAAGPIARVYIPFRVPSGFHCNYYSVDSLLYRQALAA